MHLCKYSIATHKKTTREFFNSAKTFKNLDGDQTRLDEAVRDLLPKCSMPEIGFGNVNAKSYTIQRTNYQYVNSF